VPDQDEQTKLAEWLSQSGPLIRGSRLSGYDNELHPYRPILESLVRRAWLRISECLRETALRRDERYNDHLLKADINDALLVRPFDVPHI
jgi:hypothetical protein